MVNQPWLSKCTLRQKSKILWHFNWTGSDRTCVGNQLKFLNWNSSVTRLSVPISVWWLKWNSLASDWLSKVRVLIRMLELNYLKTIFEQFFLNKFFLIRIFFKTILNKQFLKKLFLKKLFSTHHFEKTLFLKKLFSSNYLKKNYFKMK